MVNGLQLLDTWQNYFGAPEGARLGLLVIGKFTCEEFLSRAGIDVEICNRYSARPDRIHSFHLSTDTTIGKTMADIDRISNYPSGSRHPSISSKLCDVHSRACNCGLRQQHPRMHLSAPHIRTHPSIPAATNDCDNEHYWIPWHDYGGLGDLRNRLTSTKRLVVATSHTVAGRVISVPIDDGLLHARVTSLPYR